jgi:uncharacterized protein YjlB
MPATSDRRNRARIKSVTRSLNIVPPALDPAVSAERMTVESMTFPPSGFVPNHPHLPALIYRNAIVIDPRAGDPASLFEDLFAKNGWQGIWRDGVFDYQHYHTGAHEVLGIANGRGLLLVGGPDGTEISVHAGDCLVLPAGTGHMKLEASRDFVVVGAYPPSQHADLQTGPADSQGLSRISSLPVPQTDPLRGRDGPLLRHWVR